MKIIYFIVILKRKVGKENIVVDSCNIYYFFSYCAMDQIFKKKN